jgi:hypothetical protein
VAQAQGDYARAAALSEESLALRRELGDKHGIAHSLGKLGRVASARDDYALATVLLEESLTLFRELGDKLGMAYGLEGLAAVATAPGTVPEVRHHAARQLGAASALRAAIGAPLPPNERADHERTVAALRAALGDAAFEAAWAERQALLLGQAVALAQKELQA